MNTGMRLLTHFAAKLLALFYPQGNRCHLCGQPMLGEAAAALCQACQGVLEASALPEDEQVLKLDEQLPLAFFAYRHETAARALVHQLKYADDRWAAQPLALGMAGAFAPFAALISQEPLLVPVPLHPKREKHRGYNQSMLLAQHVSFHTGLPLAVNALVRIRATRPQVSGDIAFRRSNVKGAFAVPNAALVEGRAIVLVDDVCTTGSTAISCAKALLDAGAASVSLITACKA